MKTDIQNRKDIESLVDAFYSKVVQNENLALYFTNEMAVDWEHHKPIMADFWEFNLFQTPMKYMRNVMNPHLELNKKKPIDSALFDIWIALFSETVDSMFEGPKANHAKESAFTIGVTMQYKIKKFSENSK